MKYEYWSTTTTRKGITLTQWYWHLKAANGRIVADGAEGYSSKSNVLRAIRSIRRNRLFLPDVMHVERRPDR